ncbi:MAG TPA: TetR family transcriptional regulator [Pyrinomonadaceae bacterium]|nr:TetR family transcriptional regulator [Pyrinomonadaceae bacterium]
MRKGEQTRQEIIRKAAPIFNQKGYDGAALSDLMRATGLEKGGIYPALLQQRDTSCGGL